MKLLRCNNGHFYDGDKFQDCPHCGGSRIPTPAPAPMQTPTPSFGGEDRTVALGADAAPAADVTVPLGGGSTVFDRGDVTVPLGGFGGADVTVPLGADVTVPLGGGSWAQNDDEKTVSFYELNNVNVPGAAAKGEAPAVGWLICVKGKLTGRDWRLVAGRNSIGREAGMDVQLSGEASVSRHNHAAIVYEPRQNKFYAVPGESRALAYLNGDVLLGREEMKKNDRLELGESVLMLIPCCDADFSWTAI